MDVRLRSTSGICYLDPSFILDYADVSLVSKDGHVFRTDKTVLAAASKLLRRLLLDQDDQDVAVIHTQVPHPHLALFCQFATTGTIPVSQWDAGLISSFGNLGVNLSALEMDTVSNGALAFYQNQGFIDALLNVQISVKKEDAFDNGELILEDFNGDDQQITRKRSADSTEADLEEDMEDAPLVKKRSKGGRRGKRPRKPNLFVDDVKNEDPDSWAVDDIKEDINNTAGGAETDFEDLDFAPKPKGKRYSQERTRRRQKRGMDLDERGFRFNHKDFFHFPQNVKRERGAYPCPSCKRAFKHEHQLAQHQLRHANPDSIDRPWFCDWCEDVKSFKCVDDLVHHRIADHPDQASECDRCKTIMWLKEDSSLDHHTRCKVLCGQCVCCGTRFAQKVIKQLHNEREGERHSAVPYPCPMCPPGTEFTSFKDHKEHCNRVHGGVMVQPCYYCPEVYGTEKLKLDHMRVDHGKEQAIAFPQKGERDIFKEFQCTHCVLGYSSRERYDQHIARHGAKAVGEQNSWPCTSCDKKFSTRHELSVHNKTDHGDKPLSCHICNKEFPPNKFGNLRNHIKQVHERVEPVEAEYCKICICCGKTFKKSSQYSEHIKSRGRFHDNRCAQCPDLTFDTWPEHEDHVKKVHGGKFVSRCKYCPEYFDNDALRRKHIHEVHSDELGERVLCPQCGKSTLKSNMKEHILKFHGDGEMPCDICHKVCKTKWQLYSHKRTHDQGQPCPSCGENVNPKKMNRHILVKHTPDHLKPFRCHLCTKGFADEKNLKFHIYTHTGEKPFKCDICTAAFAHTGNLAAHIRAHKGIHRKK